MSEPEEQDEAPSWLRLSGLVAGPLLALAAGLAAPESLGRDGAIALALLVWMATWWLTLAVDLAATALLPLVVLPIAGVGSFTDAARHYASDVLFLFGGGALLAIALERYGLSARFARLALRIAGTSPGAVVAALMAVTALLSAFVSNTATVATMLPIGLAASAAVPTSIDRATRLRFGGACALGIAYAASIGGSMTIIGSPPNAIAAKFIAKETGGPFTFTAWMAYGLPAAILLLPAAWFVLCRMIYPIRGFALDPEVARAELAETTPIRDRSARTVLAIFLFAVVGWLTRPLWGGLLPGLGDAGVAVIAAVALFCAPATIRPFRPLLRWRDVKAMPWGVLILFGGGLSMADAIERTGVSAWIGASAGEVGALPLWALVLATVTICCFASELASNTALAATAMPVLGGLAMARGVPIEPLAVSAALGSSLAFMLPVGTPPNAMVYASGLVRPVDMAKAGLILNGFAIVLVGAVCVVVGDWSLPDAPSDHDQDVVERFAPDVGHPALVERIADGNEQIRPFMLGTSEDLGEEAHRARRVGQGHEPRVVDRGE